MKQCEANQIPERSSIAFLQGKGKHVPTFQWIFHCRQLAAKANSALHPSLQLAVPLEALSKKSMVDPDFLLTGRQELLYN